MVLFGEIMADYAKIAESSTEVSTLYTLAALSGNGKKGCLLIADYGGIQRQVTVKFKAAAKAKRVSAVILDGTRDLLPVEFEQNGDELTLIKGQAGSAAFLVRFEF